MAENTVPKPHPVMKFFKDLASKLDKKLETQAKKKSCCDKTSGGRSCCGS